MDRDLIATQSRLEDSGWWFRGRAAIVESLLPPPAAGDSLVVDVGCGWGGVTRRLAPWGRVIGIEPSSVGRHAASARGVEVVEGSANALPIDDESVDLALATDVIEHLDDDVGALREIVRVLKPDGAVLITVPAYPALFSGHDRALGHYRRYTRDTLLGACASAGLTARRVTHFNTLLFPIAAVTRLIDWRRETRTDPGVLPGPLNEIFFRAFASERRLLRHADLPFGLSLAVVAARRHSTRGTSPSPHLR